MRYRIKYSDLSTEIKEYDTLCEAFLKNYHEPWEVELDEANGKPHMIGIEECDIVYDAVFKKLVDSIPKWNPNPGYMEFVDVKDIGKEGVK